MKKEASHPNEKRVRVCCSVPGRLASRPYSGYRILHKGECKFAGWGGRLYIFEDDDCFAYRTDASMYHECFEDLAMEIIPDAFDLRGLLLKELTELLKGA